MNDNKQTLNLLKEYSTLIVFILGIFGTLFTLMLQAIATVFEIGKYNALGIPLNFIEQEYSNANAFRIIFMIISIIVSIAIAILVISHSRQTRAYLKYKQHFHTSKISTFDKIEPYLDMILFTLVPLSGINCISLLLFQSEKIKVMIVQQLVLLYCEILSARAIVTFLESYRKIKYRKYRENKIVQFKALDEKDQEQVLSEDQIEKLEYQFLPYEAILPYEKTGAIIGLIFGVCFAFAAAYSFGSISAIEPRCQIVNIESRPMVVMATYQDNYILAPIKIKRQNGEKTVLYIYNMNQYIQPLDGLRYEVIQFDEIQLMNSK